MILLFFSTLHNPCVTEDLLDPKLLSEALTKLAKDGVGVDDLQVNNKTRFRMSLILNITLLNIDVFLCY